LGEGKHRKLGSFELDQGTAEEKAVLKPKISLKNAKSSGDLIKHSKRLLNFGLQD
jgi:hypothetical protein